MKRSLLVGGILIAAAFLLSGTSTEAVKRQFAEKFLVNGAAIAEGEPGIYNFDKNHTFIGFRVKHMGLIEVPGYFRDFSGAINYDPKDLSKSSVNFTAKMASVDTGVAGRDNHLKTADFFEVEKFPEMTFKSTKIEKKGEGWVMTGELTMKGVTRPISMPFSVTGFLPGNQRQGMRMGATGETTINRRDFGVNYGQKLPTGVDAVSDNVSVWLQIEALQQREAAARPAGE